LYPPGADKQYSVTALICTLNEEDSLPYVLQKIPAWVDEVLIVDGNSTDKTVEFAQKVRSNIKIVYQPGKGKGDALKIGIDNASGEIIVTLDADDATDPVEMYKFLDKLLDGYDYVKGTRFIKGKAYDKPFHRVLGNWVITITFNILFFRAYTDMCSGYNTFWSKRVQDLQLFSTDGYENEPLINTRIAKTPLKVIECGHADRGRRSGTVKESSWRQGFKAIKSIVRERLRG
jgi:glycosyltransferase involved in cell wall biosynthesis